MASLTYKVVAQVPPDKAFQYVADIKRHAEWGMDDMKVDPVTGGPTKVGSRFNAVGHLLGKPNPSTVTVTAYEPPRRLATVAQKGGRGLTGPTPRTRPFPRRSGFPPCRGL